MSLFVSMVFVYAQVQGYGDQNVPPNSKADTLYMFSEDIYRGGILSNEDHLEVSDKDIYGLRARRFVVNLSLSLSLPLCICIL